ncbi:hypothetical protein N7528_008990 [Penicillium herquei]|nr:hypothetical protein N7528_008990 [Penicillium herquei]
MLDRLSSVSHGQYGGVQTKNVRVLHPSSEGNWSPPNSSERFQYVPPIKLTHANCPNRLWHYHIDLLAFMDRSNQLLIQPVNLSIPANCQEWKNTFRKLDMMLSTWHKNLPLEDKEPQTKFDPMWVMVFATYYIIKLRLYTVAAFPSTTSPYLKSSTAARSSCRQIIGDLASLATSVPSHALDQLGPMFAFALWIASRSLLILWTTGYEKSYGPMPADLGILLSSLQRLALRWPCAQRYSDLIQLILDTKDTANGPSILDIFNDTKRTAHGLQERLAPISLNMFTDLNLTSFDFLEGSGFDTGDPFTPLNMVPLGIELGDDWL